MSRKGLIIIAVLFLLSFLLLVLLSRGYRKIEELKSQESGVIDKVEVQQE